MSVIDQRRCVRCDYRAVPVRPPSNLGERALRRPEENFRRHAFLQSGSCGCHWWTVIRGHEDQRDGGSQRWPANAGRDGQDADHRQGTVRVFLVNRIFGLPMLVWISSIDSRTGRIFRSGSTGPMEEFGAGRWGAGRIFRTSSAWIPAAMYSMSSSPATRSGMCLDFKGRGALDVGEWDVWVKKSGLGFYRYENRYQGPADQNARGRGAFAG